MQLRRQILLHILLEDGMEVKVSPPSPNLRMTIGEILVIYRNEGVNCLQSFTMENT